MQPGLRPYIPSTALSSTLFHLLSGIPGALTTLAGVWLGHGDGELDDMAWDGHTHRQESLWLPATSGDFKVHEHLGLQPAPIPELAASFPARYRVQRIGSGVRTLHNSRT